MFSLDFGAHVNYNTHNGIWGIINILLRFAFEGEVVFHAYVINFPTSGRRVFLEAATDSLVSSTTLARLVVNRSSSKMSEEPEDVKPKVCMYANTRGLNND